MFYSAKAAFSEFSLSDSHIHNHNGSAKSGCYLHGAGTNAGEANILLAFEASKLYNCEPILTWRLKKWKYYPNSIPQNSDRYYHLNLEFMHLWKSALVVRQFFLKKYSLIILLKNVAYYNL